MEGAMSAEWTLFVTLLLRLPLHLQCTSNCVKLGNGELQFSKRELYLPVDNNEHMRILFSALRNNQHRDAVLVAQRQTRNWKWVCLQILINACSPSEVCQLYCTYVDTLVLYPVIYRVAVLNWVNFSQVKDFSYTYVHANVILVEKRELSCL